MPILSAENNFKKGLEALVDNNHVEAGMHFRRAMDIEHQRHVREPDMRYVSYYGLCLAKAHFRFKEGISACRRACLRRDRDPEMYLNLGRVLLLAGEPQQAFDTFEKGLRLRPDHALLLHELVRAERRVNARLKRPSTGLLSRLLGRGFGSRRGHSGRAGGRGVPVRVDA